MKGRWITKQSERLKRIMREPKRYKKMEKAIKRLSSWTISDVEGYVY